MRDYNDVSNLPKPVTKDEIYLYNIAGGEGFEIPQDPVTRVEWYLKEIAEGGGGFTPTEAQLNAMNSGITASKVATFEAKQDALTFDDVPTSESNNVVKSGGVYSALSGKQNTVDSTTDLVVKTLTGGIVYFTEAPTADNTDGLKIVYLSAEPETKYNGYLYLIAES